MNSRLIFIGDIHGCYFELIDLLTLIEPTASDVIVSLGDFLDRGPYPDKCIELWLQRGYLAVLGNHDQRLLDWQMGCDVPFAEGFNATLEIVSPKSHLTEYLATLPLRLDFPDFDSIAVHAAMDVNRSMGCNEGIDAERNILLRGRYVRYQNGKYAYVALGKENDGDEFWAVHWKSKTKVFYGHTPTQDGNPLIMNNTYGLDTGCSYGMFLTAAILSADGKVDFRRVPARQKYWVKADRQNIVVI